MALDWRTESLRLSLFFQQPVKFDVADWKLITGQDEPETIQKTVVARTLSGPFLDGVFHVNVIGSRIDCMLLPKAPTEMVEEGYFPHVGIFAAACSAFVDATKLWLEGIQEPVVRMAVGGGALAKCADLQDAYSALLGMLQSVKGDPTRMRELIFRVNWPVLSQKVQGILLNRISAWSVLQIRLMVQTDQSAVINETAAAQVIRMEFDNSTDANRLVPFDQTNLVPIYEELVALALENAEKGEMP